MPLQTIEQVEEVILDRMADAAIRPGIDRAAAKDVIRAALNAVELSLYDIHRLYYGGDTICSGFCGEDYH